MPASIICKLQSDMPRLSQLACSRTGRLPVDGLASRILHGCLLLAFNPCRVSFLPSYRTEDYIINVAEDASLALYVLLCMIINFPPPPKSPFTGRFLSN